MLALARKSEMNHLHASQLLLFAVLIVLMPGHVAATESPTREQPKQAMLTPSATEQQRWISAIGNDRVDRLARMLAQYDPPSLLDLTAANGKNALMVASKKGDLALARRLVSAGANVHDTTQTNGTPFMFAVLGNHRTLAQWLIDEGADINVVGSNGWTALTIAAAKGNQAMLNWLLTQGADAQLRDVYRYTPFLRAVDNGHERTASVLLALPETDVNAQDEYDNTALHHAVSAGNVSMIQLLLSHGAAADIANRDGVTATDLAAENSAIRLLFETQ